MINISKTTPNIFRFQKFVFPVFLIHDFWLNKKDQTGQELLLFPDARKTSTTKMQTMLRNGVPPSNDWKTYTDFEKISKHGKFLNNFISDVFRTIFY